MQHLLLEKVISFINLFLFPLKKILNSKATECRSLLFIPGPVCCCRIQEWVLLPIFDIGHCSAVVQGCRGHCTSPDAAQPLGQDGAASRGDSHEMHHGEM